MNSAAAIVLGLLLGWLAEWVVDWLYWRRRIHTSTSENLQFKEHLAALESDNLHLTEHIAALETENLQPKERSATVESENLQLKERIAALEEEINIRSESFDIAAITDAKGNDNLQAIKGIGPVFAKRLNEAGFSTFEQVARLTPADMEKILGTLFKRFFAKENTILAQAREFAQRMAKHRARKS